MSAKENGNVQHGAEDRPDTSKDDGNTETNNNTLIEPSRPELAKEYAQKDEEDAVNDYNAPIEWWFLSTLVPLISGTFGPMASAFNICALAVHWRTTVDPSSTESEGTLIHDPSWLLAVNGVSLAIAILANLCLLGQMTGRLSDKHAAPFTIAGWYISSLLLLGLVASAPSHLPLPTTTPATYSQAFYYAIFACALYFILATALLATALAFHILQPPFSHSFKLTLSQRSVMLQTIAFLTYLLATGAVYSRIEGWNFLDAVYFANVTLFTIGYGDHTPQTHLGRSLFFPMATGGILFVGLIIASVRTLVLEAGSQKISTRMVEKARHKALKHANPETGHVKLRGFKARQIAPSDDTPEVERRRAEFDVMREVQKQAAHDNRTIALIVSGMSFCTLWFVGAVVFWQAESALGGGNWSYFESLYFTYVSLTTIGYGDFYPQTNSAKPAFVFWALIALPTLTVLIGALGDTISDFVAATVLWLGQHIPENLNFLKDAKHTALKKKNRTGEFTEAKPPGFMDEEDNATDLAKDLGDDPTLAKALQAISGQNINSEGNDTGEGTIQDKSERDALANSYRLHAVLREMQNVVQHVNASPPRKYTYEEWTWFMKLIYEDEEDEEAHRLPWEQDANVAPPLRSDSDQKWSWMGQESPLMSMEDEPMWVLTRLLEIANRRSRNVGDGMMKEWKEKRAKGVKDHAGLDVKGDS